MKDRGPELFVLGFSSVAALFGLAFFGVGFAVAAVCAGILFAADVAALRLIVSVFTGRGREGKMPVWRVAVLFIFKIALLVGIAVFLILFARLDILGFTTGLTAGVAGIIAAGLLGKSGTF